MTTIRPAAPSDVEAIAALHVQSWRASYRGILPDAFLDGPVEQDRVSHWYELMESAGCGRVILVAETDDGLAGMVSAAPSSGDGFDAYIEHLHVRPGLKGSGVGRGLLGDVTDLLLAKGCRSAYLLVFDRNTEAIGFYERLGGETEQFGQEDMAGASIARSRVAWRDLPALASACRRVSGPPQRTGVSPD